MGRNTSVFDNQEVDLGVDSLTGGYSRREVDDMLKHSAVPAGIVCICCGSTPSYKLIPKKPEYATEEVLKRGYICNNCLQMGDRVNPSQYGIRELKG